MFDKLRKRIFRSIVLVAAAFVLVISAISYGVIVSNIFQSQRSRAVNNAESAANGCETYVNAAMGFVENAAKQNAVINALSDGSYGVSQLLDALCTYAVKIDGAALYGADGYLSYSSGLGSLPQLGELLAVEDIKAFWESSDTNCVSVRRTAVARTYNRVFYNVEKGVVSCLCKVLDENGKKLGLLAADILPETLYSVKFDYNAFGEKSRGFIFYDGRLLTDEISFSNYCESFSEGVTKDGKYFVSKASFGKGADAALFVPLKEFTVRLMWVAVFFLSLDAILIGLSVIYAEAVANSVTKPLDSLHRKMISLS